jgi:hypothetical protein
MFLLGMSRLPLYVPNIEGESVMKIGSKSAYAFTALVLLSIFGTAVQTNPTLADGGSQNGAAGQMPAFYDGELFTINIYQLSQNAANSVLANNKSVNMIFASNDLDQPQDFIPVINAIQGDGFNPLWHQILIVFNEGFTPHQFMSDDEVEAAATGTNPEITLVDTGEVYRCSVVGNK